MPSLWIQSIIRIPCLLIRVCIIVLMMQGNPVAAQQSNAPEYQVKAVFLFNFSKFISWPSAAFESDNSPFIIGIAGDDPFGNYLDQTVTGEFVHNHPVIIKRALTPGELKKCHLLFINRHGQSRLSDLLPHLQGGYTLTVSDGATFVSQGGMIAFETLDNRIQLHINIKTVQQQSLTVSSKLLRLAHVTK